MNTKMIVGTVTCNIYICQHKKKNEILVKSSHKIKQYPATPEGRDILQLHRFLRFLQS